MTITLFNRLAFASLGMAKISGVIGLILGYTRYRTLGGVILALAFGFIVLTITLCLKALKIQKTQLTDNLTSY